MNFSKYITIIVFILFTPFVFVSAQIQKKLKIDLICADSVFQLEPFRYGYQVTALEDIDCLECYLSYFDGLYSLKNDREILILNKGNKEYYQTRSVLDCSRPVKPTSLKKGESVIKEGIQSLFPFITVGKEEQSLFLNGSRCEVLPNFKINDIFDRHGKKIFSKKYLSKEDNDCAEWLLTQPVPCFLYTINQYPQRIIGLEGCPTHERASPHPSMSALDYILEKYTESKFAGWAAYHKACLDIYFKADGKLPKYPQRSFVSEEEEDAEEAIDTVEIRKQLQHNIDCHAYTKRNCLFEKVKENKQLILKYLPYACLKLKIRMKEIYKQLIELEGRAGYKDQYDTIGKFDALYKEYEKSNLEEW